MREIHGSQKRAPVRGLLLALPLVLALPAGAAAHPHVWIEARNEVVFDAEQRVAALRVFWRFDEFYSLFAVEGLDGNGDGRVDPAELQPLADLNVTSLQPYDYFTEVLGDGETLAFGAARGQESHYENGILSLTFEIPLAEPVDPRRVQVRFRSFDPTFYIAIEPAPQNAARLAGRAPDACRIVVEENSPPEQLSLSEADFLESATSQAIGRLYATTLILLCDPPGATQ